jgi:hypothetical protein
MAASGTRRPAGVPLLDHLATAAPWLIGAYRSAIETISAAGLRVAIENENDGCLLADSDDMLAFFGELADLPSVRLIWDIQNMWEAGEFPSVRAYERLRGIVGYVHVKGGIAGADGKLKYRSSLREAAWPVTDIVSAVVADDVSPVICVNPCHGEPPPGYDARATAVDDIRLVQSLIQAGG